MKNELNELMEAGYNQGAANWIAAQIEQGRGTLDKWVFQALDLGRLDKINAEHAQHEAPVPQDLPPADVAKQFDPMPINQAAPHYEVRICDFRNPRGADPGTAMGGCVVTLVAGGRRDILFSDQDFYWGFDTPGLPPHIQEEIDALRAKIAGTRFAKIPFVLCDWNGVPAARRGGK